MRREQAGRSKRNNINALDGHTSKLTLQDRLRPMNHIVVKEMRDADRFMLLYSCNSVT